MEQTLEPRFTLSELVEATGLTERTIRYYISAGIVPPALGRGRSRYYTPQHLQNLTQVASLRAQRLSIDEIRERMLASVQVTSALDAAPVWRHISVHSTLELHVRDDAPDGILALARTLEAQSREWLGSEDDDLALDT